MSHLHLNIKVNVIKDVNIYVQAQLVTSCKHVKNSI